MQFETNNKKHNEKISALVPTRNRINTTHGNFVEQLIESAEQTADDFDSVEFVFYVDNDDDDSLNYFKNGKYANYDNIKFISGDRIVLSKMWNNCYEASSGDILFHCGDDIRFRTSGWDTVVRNKFNEFGDKILFAFGNDGKRGNPRAFGTHGFIHRKWADTVGYFVPPYFSCDYNDTWLNDVAKMIGRWFYIDIYTEHIHPRSWVDPNNKDLGKKYVWDKTHQERLERNKQDNNEALYKKLSSKRKEDFRKLQNVIDSFNKEATKK
jgi:glycosyl transferase/beta-hydroxylase protein BlmF